MKFRVVKRCFIDGALYEPGAVVDLDEKFKGSALEAVPDPKPPLERKATEKPAEK